METKLTSLKALAAAVGLALGSAALAQDEQGAQQPGAGAQQQQQAGQAQAGSQALDDLLQQHDNLSDFVQALRETGLADTLTQQGQSYTLLAPTNEAIEQMGDRWEELQMPENREELVQLLRDHLIADQVDAERARTLPQALTVSGATLNIEESDGELMIEGARVAETDIRSGGLTVHTVEEVLQPTGQRVAAAGQQQTGQFPAFEEVDTDSDGEISRTELAAIEGLDFASADENQDGNVSRQEYMQATQDQQQGQQQDEGGGLFGGDEEEESEDQGGGLFE